MVCRASSMPPLDYLRSSGGQMRDQAIHFFDLLRFLTGDEVRTVAAMGAALALPDIAGIWRCRHLHPDDADARRCAGAAGQYPPHRPRVR